MLLICVRLFDSAREHTGLSRPRSGMFWRLVATFRREDAPRTEYRAGSFYLKLILRCANLCRGRPKTACWSI
jgi:hypothetical protein